MKWFVRLTCALGVVGAVITFGGLASAQCLSPPGDINNDNETDIVDIQCAILVSLNELSGGGPEGLPDCLDVPTAAVDVNCDSAINVSDLLVIINFGFQLPLGAAIDPDGDGCPDACQVPGSVYLAPVYATGSASNGSFTLTATGGATPGSVPSMGGGFVLEPRAIGFEE